MALYINEDQKQPQVNTIYVNGTKVVQAVYQGLRLVWQYIKSCFGRGYWIDDKPWSNTDAWAN